MKRSDNVAEIIKSRISERSLRPGDRLPQEKALIEEFGVSKGTIREALKTLETQGLIVTRTGPGGGALIADVPPDHAMSLLSNYFYFKPLSIHDIYELRIQLEPEMAASLVGRLDDEAFQRLKRTMTIYSSPVESPEREHQQRLDEFAFHEVLADLCTNPLLSFVCRFLISLLKNLTICRQIYDQPNPELFDAGRFYQMSLYDALVKEDAAAVREIMHDHMVVAEEIMVAREAEVRGGFLPNEGGKSTTVDPDTR